MPKLSLAKLERHLYAAADRLRQEGLDAATYKDYIFGLLMFAQHMLAVCRPGGMVATVMPNGVLADSFKKLIADKVSGSSIPHLFQRDMVTLGIAAPSITEQEIIAAVLDLLDDVIASTEAVIFKLIQIRTGLLHDLLTHGLDERGELRDPRAHPEQFQGSPLGRIPKDWNILSLEQLLARVPHPLRSGPFGSGLLKRGLKATGIPLLGIDNVRVEYFDHNFSRFVDEEKFAELNRYAVRPRDLMITVMGAVGRCCVVPDETSHRSTYGPSAWTLSAIPRHLPAGRSIMPLGCSGNYAGMNKEV